MTRLNSMCSCFGPILTTIFKSKIIHYSRESNHTQKGVMKVKDSSLISKHQTIYIETCVHFIRLFTIINPIQYYIQCYYATSSMI